MKIGFADLWELTKGAFNEFIEDKGPKLGASLAYYTMFSIAPLLLIAIAIAGSIFGPEAARGEIVYQIQGMVGPEGAEVIETMLKNAYASDGNTLATIIGIVVLVIASTGVFVELQESLNMVWNVKLKQNLGFMGLIKDRILSFAMVVAMGFLLMASLVVSAGLSFLGTYMQGILPIPEFVLQVVNFVISVAVITALFAAVFKFLPDVELGWSDVWVGAIITSVLFNIGKYLIGLYLGNSTISSSYGAAGSFVVLMVWIYWTAQILFLGAEYTQVYSQRFGSGFKPRRNAVAVGNELEQKEVAEAAEAAPKSEEPADGQQRIEFPEPGKKGTPKKTQYSADKPVQPGKNSTEGEPASKKSTLIAAGIAAAWFFFTKDRN